ncbi:hypothetical protein J2X69_003816 [Algoriphagus sp. 4150]|uniref:hypothetical protein n=1 Tax=Algoriphagus sp. 4150 TaxID=2817756 RepID=UPI0028627EC6|nr:hypothetical protein [Algoriphagus sp. 4150]MDR7131452.1 hypothetical protein [Algoriphagus sp. 4150]
MSKSIIKYVVACCCLFAWTACDSDNDPAPGPGQEENGHYIMMTSAGPFNSGLQGGYFGVFEELPSGNVTNIKTNSLQIASAFGFRSYGKWFFNQFNTAGEAGLQKYLVENGRVEEAGFIPNAQPSYLIVDDTHGFYPDPERGLLKIQTFNPTSMQRTGEIDLTSLKVDGVEYQVIGKHTLAAKEGKLFAGITYSTTALQGYGGDVVDYVEFAVIDIASGQLEKTIKYDGLKSIGWGSSGNKMWTLGDDGALYFYATDLGNGFQNSSIIRIKQGETDFDREWEIKAGDYMERSTFATALVKGGKLYTQFSSEPLAADFSNLQAQIWDYYAIDLATKQRTKIEGMPKTFYAWGSNDAIIELDGKIYFWVSHSGDNVEGYYELTGEYTATRTFNVTDGGQIWGFVKLK